MLIIFHFEMNYFTVDSAEPLPLMEGEGRSFKVLGFNQNQRAAFVQILMRYRLFLFFLFQYLCIYFMFIHQLPTPPILPFRSMYIADVCESGCFYNSTFQIVLCLFCVTRMSGMYQVCGAGDL